jgi:hypothetical protein
VGLVVSFADHRPKEGDFSLSHALLLIVRDSIYYMAHQEWYQLLLLLSNFLGRHGILQNYRVNGWGFEMANQGQLSPVVVWF